MIAFTVQTDIACPRPRCSPTSPIRPSCRHGRRTRVLALTVAEGALPIDARITLEPHDAGTRLRFDAHGQPEGLMRLAQPVLSRTLKRQSKQHVNTLEPMLEDAAG